MAEHLSEGYQYTKVNANTYFRKQHLHHTQVLKMLKVCKTTRRSKE